MIGGVTHNDVFELDISMNYAETVEVANCLDQLPNNSFSLFLSQAVPPLLQVFKEIFTLHVLHYDIVVSGGLKYVFQFDDIVMLTHLEYFEFSSLLEKFLSTHFGFENRLDGKLFFGRNVGCKIYNTKLTTSQKLLNSVGIINVFCTAYFLKSFDPFLLLSLSAVVENADLILSKNYLNRVQGVA